MISWLFVIILAYLFFSLSSLGDKVVLKSAQSPKLYVFYVGVMNILVLFLIPFVGLSVPDSTSLLWVFLTSLVFIGGLYFLFVAVNKFEVSRVVPLVGSVQPLFVLLLSWIFFKAHVLSPSNLLAFLVLLLASFIISFEKKLNLTKDLLKYSLITAFLVALGFILIKIVFLEQAFLQGIIWIGIFNFLISLVFLLDSNVRKEIFVKKSAFDKKTLTLVILTQGAGGVAGFLQNFAIYLAPESSLAIMNSLRGIQYVFLFVLTLIFSYFFPKIIREDITKGVVLQKTASIFLIILGLAILFYFQG